MKLRLYSMALLQAMGIYEMTAAVHLESRPVSMTESGSEAMTEAEAEVEGEGDQFLHSCIQHALEAKIVDGLSKCKDLKDCSQFDLFDGESTLELDDFVIEGLSASCFEKPMTFDINMDVPLTLDLGPAPACGGDKPAE